MIKLETVNGVVLLADVLEWLHDFADTQRWQEHRIAIHHAADVMGGTEDGAPLTTPEGGAYTTNERGRDNG